MRRVLTFSVRHPAASGVPRQGFQYPHCRPLGPGGTGHPSTSYTGSRTGLICKTSKKHTSVIQQLNHGFPSG